MNEEKAWCGKYCPEHFYMKEKTDEAKGMVSMKIFTIVVLIGIAVFGTMFGLWSKTDSTVATVDKTQAVISAAQERITITLDRMGRDWERHQRSGGHAPITR